MAELYEFARLSFTGEVIRANQVVLFPRVEKYLNKLYQSNVERRTPFRIEVEGENGKNPVIKQMWHIIQEENGNQGPDYDQITYQILKECDKILLTKWFINTF